MEEKIENNEMLNDDYDFVLNLILIYNKNNSIQSNRTKVPYIEKSLGDKSLKENKNT